MRQRLGLAVPLALPERADLGQPAQPLGALAVELKAQRLQRRAPLPIQLPRGCLGALLGGPAAELGVVAVAVPHVRVAVPLAVPSQLVVPPAPLGSAVADQAVPPRRQARVGRLVGFRAALGARRQQQRWLLLHQADDIDAFRAFRQLHVKEPLHDAAGRQRVVQTGGSGTFESSTLCRRPGAVLARPCTTSTLSSENGAPCAGR